jgi:hypothetical protein
MEDSLSDQLSVRKLSFLCRYRLFSVGIQTLALLFSTSPGRLRSASQHAAAVVVLVVGCGASEASWLPLETPVRVTTGLNALH